MWELSAPIFPKISLFPGLSVRNVRAQADGEGVEVVLCDHDSMAAQPHRVGACFDYCGGEVVLERFRVVAGDFDHRMCCSHLIPGL